MFAILALPPLILKPEADLQSWFPLVGVSTHLLEGPFTGE